MPMTPRRGSWGRTGGATSARAPATRLCSGGGEGGGRGGGVAGAGWLGWGGVQRRGGGSAAYVRGVPGAYPRARPQREGAAHGGAVGYGGRRELARDAATGGADGLMPNGHDPSLEEIAGAGFPGLKREVATLKAQVVALEQQVQDLQGRMRHLE